MTRDADKKRLLDDIKGGLKDFQGETDRATAVLGAAFLDVQLEMLLKSAMRDDAKELKLLFDPGRDIGGFKTRARLAYCLQLIPREIFDELGTIGKIRNVFAHGLHGLAFSSPEITDLCQELKVPDDLFRVGWSGFEEGDEKDPRARYVSSVAITQGVIAEPRKKLEQLTDKYRTVLSLIHFPKADSHEQQQR